MWCIISTDRVSSKFVLHADQQTGINTNLHVNPIKNDGIWKFLRFQ